MSFSGGVYTLPGPALVTGEVVSATENNQFRNDVAGAFNVTMLRNGTSTATANLPMGGYKLTGLGVATTSGDALSYGQAAVISDLTASGTVTISSGTANGVAYLNGSKVLTTGTDLVFTSTGLGIGTSSPGNKLDVVGNIGIKSAGALKLYNAANNATSELYSDATGLTQFSHTGVIRWLNDTATTERMRIDSSGNVGIGTSSPDTKLVVAGDATNTLPTSWGQLRIKGATNANQLLMIGYDTTNDYGFIQATKVGTAYQNLVLQSGGGNVGIGTSSPTRKLQVYTTSSDYQLRLGFSDAYFYDIGRSAADGLFYFYGNQSGANGYVFGGINGERMRIDSSGNLLVGTTSQRDVERLSVVGSSGTGILVQATNAGSNSYSIIFRNAANATVGSCYCTSTSTAYNTSSDYRLKENIQPMQNALDVVAQLKPVTYTWKADGSEGQGFIAHELQAVVPDCVTGEKDGTRIEEYEITPAVPAVYEEVVIPAVLDEEGNVIAAEMIDKQLVTAEIPAVMGEREVPVYQGIDTSFLVATLTKAIQELKAELDATKAEVAALKNTAA